MSWECYSIIPINSILYINNQLPSQFYVYCNQKGKVSLLYISLLQKFYLNVNICPIGTWFYILLLWETEQSKD